MTSVLDTLVAHLGEAARWNEGVEACPMALVWCDPANECAPLMPALRTRLPQLLTLGPIDVARRTGPGFWLRAAAERAVPEIAFPADAIPILWLPGIARSELHGSEGTPLALAPVVWLAVAGQLFGHVNGKDWTLRALLSADRGPVRLKIAGDAPAAAALSRALPRLLAKPIDEARAAVWDADRLDRLISDDLHGDMLDWIDGAFDAGTDPARFEAFAARATRDLKFDPRKADRDAAAGLLVAHEGAWGTTWERFSRATAGFDGVVQRLSVKEPPSNFLTDAGAYPRANAEAEDRLRNELVRLATMPLAEARAAALSADATHGARRETVWAARGMAPLTCALKHLAIIAAEPALPVHDAAALAHGYKSSGWRADWAALQALVLVKTDADRKAVSAAIRALYLPWLDAGALALQALAGAGKVTFAKPAAVDAPPDVLLFVDGLRFDLAQALCDRLDAVGIGNNLDWRWSGWPTVTATCKPLATPVALKLTSAPANPMFSPAVTSGKPADSKAVATLMRDAGWAVGTLPLGSEPLWAETATFDEDGHKLGARLADIVAAGLDAVAEAVAGYARAGRSVRIVTDHGWLLMPGGLEKAELGAGLVENDGKRTRCALVKEGAQTSLTYVPWTWNAAVNVAAAPGARSFYATYEYAHGGISPQECILPVIDVAAGKPKHTVTIISAEWTGMRLVVKTAGAVDMLVDLRDEAGRSLLSAPRTLAADGRASMPISDDHEGKPALLVIMADDGVTRVAERNVIVGGNG